MYRADHSHPSTYKVKNVRSYLFILPYAFMVQWKPLNNAGGFYIRNTAHDISFNLN